MSRVFWFCFYLFESFVFPVGHTRAMARMRCFWWTDNFPSLISDLCSPAQLLSLCQFIDPVLPTKHLFSHERP